MAKNTPKAALQADSKKKLSFQKITTWNKWLAIFYALQGIVVLLLSTTALFPVQTSYLTQNPLATEIAGSPVWATAVRHLFDLNLAYVVAAALFAAAIVHATVATVGRKWQEAELKRGINRVRWIECGVSAALFLVAVAVVSGVADLSTLVLVFAITLLAGLLGLAVETYNHGGAKPSRVAYIMGGIVGIAPFIVLALYVWGANVYGSGDIPTFVYWLYASIVILFSAFAVNVYLQYKKIGPWKNYLYGERMYMILSVVAKTALAWQIFAGVLRP
jgi:hypothetical protein